MKRRYTVLCLSLMMAFSLVGCTQTPPAVTPTPTPTSSVSPTATPNPKYNAGYDGQVRSTEPTPGNGRSIGRSGHSAMEEAGQGIKNSLNSAGDAVQEFTHDITRTIR